MGDLPNDPGSSVGYQEANRVRGGGGVMNWAGTFAGLGIGVGILLFWALIGYLVGNYKGRGDYMKSLNWTFAVEFTGVTLSTVIIIGIALLTGGGG